MRCLKTFFALIAKFVFNGYEVVVSVTANIFARFDRAQVCSFFLSLIRNVFLEKLLSIKCS